MESFDFDEYQNEIMRRAYRKQEEAKALYLKNAPAKCPLGETCGKGVFCHVEGKVIEPHQDPVSFVDLCHDKFETCPSFLRHYNERITQKENAKRMIRNAEIQRDEDAALVEEMTFTTKEQK